MRMPWLSAAVSIALLLRAVPSARADEVAPPAAPVAKPAPAASPLNYVVASVTTTLIFQPNQGSLQGLQYDVSPFVGFGRYVTETIALELDAGPTIVRDGDTSFSLVPAAVWSFSTHVYAAARLVVPVYHQIDLALYPGVGAIYTFKNQISLAVELNALSTIGRGKPDLSFTVTPGILYSF